MLDLLFQPWGIFFTLEPKIKKCGVNAFFHAQNLFSALCQNHRSKPNCSITDQTVCCQPFARLRGGNSYGRSFLLLCFRKVQAGINTSLFGGGAWAEGMTCRNGKGILELRIETKWETKWSNLEEFYLVENMLMGLSIHFKRALSVCFRVSGVKIGFSNGMVWPELSLSC